MFYGYEIDDLLLGLGAWADESPQRRRHFSAMRDEDENEDLSRTHFRSFDSFDDSIKRVDSEGGDAYPDASFTLHRYLSERATTTLEETLYLRTLHLVP